MKNFVILLAVVCGISLTAMTFRTVTTKTKTDPPKVMVMAVDGFVLCKPPAMQRGDSTDCVMLPTNSRLVIQLRERNAGIPKQQSLNEAGYGN